MGKVFVEQEKPGRYVATKNGQEVASGTTQKLTAARAHRKNPDDAVLLERVRNTDTGSRDKWRHGFKGK